MAASDWYAVFYGEGNPNQDRFPQSITTYAVVQASSASAARNKVSAMKGSATFISNVDGPFATRQMAVDAAKRHNQSTSKQVQRGKVPGLNLNPFNWLTGIGGSIASGLEQGFVSFLTDLWDVIVGPLEVIVGVVIAMFVLAIYFKDDIMAAAHLIGMAAA